MSIRERLEEAHLLLANGRVAGALLSACAALSATSRKRYPDRKAMSDNKAFKAFLAEEMVVVTRGMIAEFFVRCPGAPIERYPDEQMPLEDLLYLFVRNCLSHEGKIGGNIEFCDSEQWRIEINEDRVIFGRGILSGLLLVPEYAPENALEFPVAAKMPKDVVGWVLFGERRAAYAPYLDAREARLKTVLAVRSS
jgi:hypothetical protein